MDIWTAMIQTRACTTMMNCFDSQLPNGLIEAVVLNDITLHSSTMVAAIANLTQLCCEVFCIHTCKQRHWPCMPEPIAVQAIHCSFTLRSKCAICGYLDAASCLRCHCHGQHSKRRPLCLKKQKSCSMNVCSYSPDQFMAGLLMSADVFKVRLCTASSSCSLSPQQTFCRYRASGNDRRG